MELWIRSQSKKELRPNPKLGIEGIKDEFYIVDRFNFDDATILGIYKTKERALEVLDEIQKILQPKIIIGVKQEPVYERDKDNNIKFIADKIVHYNEVDYKELSTYVYEMPKE